MSFQNVRMYRHFLDIYAFRYSQSIITAATTWLAWACGKCCSQKVAKPELLNKLQHYIVCKEKKKITISVEANIGGHTTHCWSNLCFRADFLVICGITNV